MTRYVHDENFPKCDSAKLLSSKRFNRLIEYTVQTHQVFFAFRFLLGFLVVPPLWFSVFPPTSSGFSTRTGGFHSKFWRLKHGQSGTQIYTNRTDQSREYTFSKEKKRVPKLLKFPKLRHFRFVRRDGKCAKILSKSTKVEKNLTDLEISNDLMVSASSSFSCKKQPDKDFNANSFERKAEMKSAYWRHVK